MGPLLLFVSCLVLVTVHANDINSVEGSCKFSLGADLPMYTPDMAITCADAVKSQINKELNASLTYLVMGAHFSQDTVNLPGFAKFFFESASEEREHAVKLMKYLSMRGELTNVKNLIEFPQLKKFEWTNGLKALEDAVELEGLVTESIKSVIHTCETPSSGKTDYHISDWLTGEYLEEQYKSLRDISGKIFTLKKLKNNRESSTKDLADFIFDKKLLGMDI